MVLIAFPYVAPAPATAPKPVPPPAPPSHRAPTSQWSFAPLSRPLGACWRFSLAAPAVVCTRHAACGTAAQQTAASSLQAPVCSRSLQPRTADHGSA